MKLCSSLLKCRMFIQMMLTDGAHAMECIFCNVSWVQSTNHSTDWWVHILLLLPALLLWLTRNGCLSTIDLNGDTSSIHSMSMVAHSVQEQMRRKSIWTIITEASAIWLANYSHPMTITALHATLDKKNLYAVLHIYIVYSCLYIYVNTLLWVWQCFMFASLCVYASSVYLCVLTRLHLSESKAFSLKGSVSEGGWVTESERERESVRKREWVSTSFLPLRLSECGWELVASRRGHCAS